MQFDTSKIANLNIACVVAYLFFRKQSENVVSASFIPINSYTFYLIEITSHSCTRIKLQLNFEFN